MTDYVRKIQVIFFLFIGLILCADAYTTPSSIPLSLPLREKIGQMLIFGFHGMKWSKHTEVAQWIDQYHIGGVIAFDMDNTGTTQVKNIQSQQQINQLNQQLQHYTRESEIKHHRPLSPLLIAIDYEGGWVDRLKTADGFEPTLSPAVFPRLSSTKIHHELQKMSSYLKKANFNFDLAPIVDVNVNPANPIIAAYKRSYSANPLVVTHFAELFVKSLRPNKIQCAFKHFPGHGSSEKDSHKGLVDVSKTWKSYELMPYQKLIMDHPTCGVVMTAHLINRQLDPSGLPATLSYKMLTGLLRGHLHFKGVIMSDDMQMKAILDNYPLEKAIPMAINAGVDLLLFANQDEDAEVEPQKIIDLIEQQVKSGVIPLQRINEAYEHLRALKQGL